MTLQSEVTWKMRKTLFLWLVPVAKEFGLTQETLFLCFNLVDRLGSKIDIARQHYQLIGLTCLWIAAKQEENHGKVPNIKKLTYVCLNTYTERDFIDMERFVLIELGFYLGHVSIVQFLSLYSTLNSITVHPRVMGLAMYLAELSIMHRRFIGVPSSLIARACLNLSSSILDGFSHLVPSDQLVTLCMQHLLDCLQHPPTALMEKVILVSFDTLVCIPRIFSCLCCC